MPSKSDAVASIGDTIKPYVGTSLLYDSNLLRLSDTVNPVLLTGKSDKSDFIKQVAAGFDMDWIISRQHIIIHANANQNWFQNFTSLDYLGWNTQAQWDWQMWNNLNGEIGYTNIQTLGSFNNLNLLVNNLQNNQSYFANAGYLFHPNGKIKFGVFRKELLYEDNSRKFSSNIEDNAELNLQYLAPTGSILGLQFLATDGQYPNRQFSINDTQDNAYTRMNYALTGDWHASSKTRIDGLIGYTQQHYAHLGSRNFTGMTGQLNLHWQASDKTLLELSAIRAISQAQNLLANFMVVQGVAFNLTWQYSPKITLTSPMFYQQQQFLGNTGTSVVGFQQQKNNVGHIGFNLMYHPLDSINIGPVLTYEKRDSNFPLNSYETLSAGVNLQVFF
jgi:exopolysaccharide biosynthesis operon protein EpsL